MLYKVLLVRLRSVLVQAPCGPQERKSHGSESTQKTHFPAKRSGKAIQRAHSMASSPGMRPPRGLLSASLFVAFVLRGSGVLLSPLQRSRAALGVHGSLPGWLMRRRYVLLSSAWSTARSCSACLLLWCSASARASFIPGCVCNVRVPTRYRRSQALPCRSAHAYTSCGSANVGAIDHVHVL